MPIEFNPNYHENTTATSVARTAEASFQRLKKRYANIDFEACTLGLCHFLKQNYDPNNLFNHYTTAVRAMYPKFGAIAYNRIGNLEHALYYWMAVNDDASDIVSTINDRSHCFVRALYESQRGNNNLSLSGLYEDRNSASINWLDNYNYQDETICGPGVLRKFGECFTGMHPDVEIVADLNTRILDLVRGFIAEYCYSAAVNLTYTQLISGLIEFNNIVPAAEKIIIAQKITEILGVAETNHLGLMGGPELNFLNNCLNANLEYLSFINTNETQMLEADIRTVIKDANEQLRFSRANRVTNININVSATAHPGPVFDVDAICAILISELPRPTNSVNLLGNVGFEVIDFSPDAQANQANNIFYQFTHRADTNTDAMQARPDVTDAAQVEILRLNRARAQGLA